MKPKGEQLDPWEAPLPLALLNLPFLIKQGRGILTHTSFPVLGQREATVALADKGAQNIHTELLTAMVPRRTQILDWGRVAPLECSSEGVTLSTPPGNKHLLKSLLTY